MHRGGRRPITGLSGISQGAARRRGLLELARAPPLPLRATVRGPGGETAAPTATRLSPHPRTHTHGLARSPRLRPAADRGPAAFFAHTCGCAAVGPGLQCAAAPVAAAVRRPRKWRKKQAAGRPREDSGPERLGRGDQPEGDAPRALEMHWVPQGFRSPGRSSQAAAHG